MDGFVFGENLIATIHGTSRYTNRMDPMAIKQPMDLRETKKDATIKDYEQH